MPIIKINPPSTKPDAVTASPKKKKERSPAYPFLSLREALPRIQKLWEHEKRNAMPVAVAAAHWDYAAKSSGALQTISALKQFGLLTDQGTGDKRHVRLSEFAFSILREQEGPERDQQIKNAALKPTIHSKLWERYHGDLPSDKTLENHLVFDLKFTEGAAKQLIKEFRDTIKFAQLEASDSVPEIESEDTVEEPMENQERPPQHHVLKTSPGAFSTSSSTVREFPVPLPSGAVASFKIPFPMTEEDFSLYSSLLNAFKAAVVKKAD